MQLAPCDGSPTGQRGSHKDVKQETRKSPAPELSHCPCVQLDSYYVPRVLPKLLLRALRLISINSKPPSCSLVLRLLLCIHEGN